MPHLEWWSDLGRDLVLSFRSMRREPTVTAAILVTVALGIGANAAIFSVTQAALLAPLPYERSDRLVYLWETRDVGNDRFSYPDFLDVRTGVRSFSRVEGYDGTNVTIAGGDVPLRVNGGRVTAGFFSMLGVTPALGRGFTEGEDGPGAPRIVLLSDALWRQRYGGDRTVIGRSMIIDGAPYAIVGVLPASFHATDGSHADIWVPIDRNAGTRADRSDHWLSLVARLRNDATVADATREVATVMRRLASDYPQTNSGRSAVIVPIRDQIVGNVRPLLLMLTGAVTLVLLIACANVAGLLLARSIARTRELAIRMALGASRGRLVRQLLTESVLLALIGGVIALWIAATGARFLVAAIPEGTRMNMTYLANVSVSGRTLIYTVAVAVITGLAFGLLPAVSASRSPLGELLRRGGRGVAGGGTKLRDVLVIGEIALTIVLLVGTGLLVRSLSGLLRVDAGFDAQQVVVARIALAGPRYATDAAQRGFFEEVLTRVRPLPGVNAVGAVSQLPLSGGGSSAFQVIGAPEPLPSARPEATRRAVAGDYFEAMRIRVVDGRQFTRQDDSTTQRVIMINESLARRLFANERAVGRRIRFYAFPGQEWEIIGVVADVRTASLDAVAPPMVYYAQAQAPENRMTLAIRMECRSTAGPLRNGNACSGAPIITAIRRTVAALDPAISVYGGGTMAQQIADSRAVFARRFPLLLVGLFAATALVLAVVGLYGVISYAVAQRTREFGVRMALGASPGAIRDLVLRRGAIVAAAGVVVGVPGALALSRALAGMLYGVGRGDPATYLVACGGLVAIALLASWIPARRATRIEPTVALRSD